MLSINNVTKQYANHLALDDISIEVPSQSIFGLLGPNGAGKTTLIRIINQIIGPDKGEILFSGTPLSQKHLYEIGYLPEERGLYKKMEVGEIALYLAQLKGLSRSEAMEKIKDWFVKFEIQGWWKKKIEELSKGMQQKIQFIITVIHDPKLIILDEPFTGFDPINTKIIRDEILRLRENGATIILSTHRMESVEELCDHIALIDKSKKVLDGAVSDLRKSYRTNLYDIEFKGNLPDLSAHNDKLEIIGHSNGEMSKVRIRIKNEEYKVNDLLNSFIPHVQVNSLNEIIPSMNDIFISKVSNKELSELINEQDSTHNN
ncbi:MAG: ATP-binding cassette domain-containing protein [Bacteroidia bacterium]|nr:ATP-binding cassette domain-containing protein [Bacteroidia bacterium]